MRCAIRWAEQVSREKEPDIIKRKKKEPSPDLVRNALAPLVPYIRLEYILPTNDQVYNFFYFGAEFNSYSVFI